MMAAVIAPAFAPAVARSRLSRQGVQQGRAAGRVVPKAAQSACGLGSHPIASGDEGHTQATGCWARRKSRCPARRGVAAAAGTSAASGDAEPTGSVPRALFNIRQRLARFDGLWNQLIPMTLLFAVMAFANTLLDSTKDTLVITAVNGGVEQIPFLLVYVVFPASLLFLVLFSYISTHFSRRATCNIVVGLFVSFFVFFGTFLSPHTATLHSGSMVEGLAQAVPSGLAGLVMCFRNWTYTLFYVAAELWGDVVLSLLFWGLANDTTNIDDAPLLYPLFGIGANAAQAAGGLFLKGIAFTSASLTASEEAAWNWQLNALIGAVTVAGVAICFLHSWIISNAGESGRARASAIGSRKLRDELKAKAANDAGEEAKDAPQMGIKESFAFVSANPQIRCLALCAMAHGVSTNLMEFAWKTHLRMLHPTPASFSATMGDVATATGVLTGLLMLVSPTIFTRLGWKGAAQANPRFLFWGGAVFFAMAIARSALVPAVAQGAAGAAASLASAPMLREVVLAGGILYVVSRASKYALLKPAEEMVYIHLDEESRTKGKAAIDVVGNQAGKSSGSLINQGLLLLCGGSLGGVLPVMLFAFLLTVRKWISAVGQLSEIRTKDSKDDPDFAAAGLELRAGGGAPDGAGAPATARPLGG